MQTNQMGTSMGMMGQQNMYMNNMGGFNQGFNTGMAQGMNPGMNPAMGNQFQTN